MDILTKPALLPRLDSDQIERRLAACPRLPSLGSINDVLRELLNAEQCYTSQVADVIRRDPSMTTRMLRLVNSVYYGLSVPVSSIEEAVFYLGVRQIRRLAIVTPVIEDLQKLAGRTGFPWREFWRHCIATAIMTRETLGEVQAGSDEVDYVAGLLHDVGKIVMVAAFPEYFEQSAHNLPIATIHAVRFHHHPGSATTDIRLVAALQVADLFVRHAAIGNSGNPEEVTTEAWVGADGWNLLFPGADEEQTFARANMERSLERLSTILEGLV